MVEIAIVTCSLISLGIGICIGWSIKKSSDSHGRLAHFKHGKKYMYTGHGKVNGKPIVSCTKEYMAKTYYFEKPASIDATRLISGTVYRYYKPENTDGGQLLTETEYKEINK